MTKEIWTLLSAAVEDLGREILEDVDGNRHPSDRVMDAKRAIEQALAAFPCACGGREVLHSFEVVGCDVGPATMYIEQEILDDEKGTVYLGYECPETYRTKGLKLLILPAKEEP